MLQGNSRLELIGRLLAHTDYCGDNLDFQQLILNLQAGIMAIVPSFRAEVLGIVLDIGEGEDESIRYSRICAFEVLLSEKIRELRGIDALTHENAALRAELEAVRKQYDIVVGNAQAAAIPERFPEIVSQQDALEPDVSLRYPLWPMMPVEILNECMNSLESDYQSGIVRIHPAKNERHYKDGLHRDRTAGLSWSYIKHLLERNNSELLRRASLMPGGAELIGVDQQERLVMITRSSDEGRHPVRFYKGRSSVAVEMLSFRSPKYYIESNPIAFSEVLTKLNDYGYELPVYDLKEPRDVIAGALALSNQPFVKTFHDVSDPLLVQMRGAPDQAYMIDYRKGPFGKSLLGARGMGEENFQKLRPGAVLVLRG